MCCSCQRYDLAIFQVLAHLCLVENGELSVFCFRSSMSEARVELPGVPVIFMRQGNESSEWPIHLSAALVGSVN